MTARPAFDYHDIAGILPHRYPFLLVDQILEIEPNRRITGLKRVTHNEPYLTRTPGEPPAVPPTILMEAVAQVGAIMILANPENRGKLIFFMGVRRVRFRRPVHAGDTVIIEATARRLRGQSGLFEGVARVGARRVADGVMTFALGSAGGLGD
jgi:3-hydroxyacyl-[acyl-carrier-protein] dehydratase